MKQFLLFFTFSCLFLSINAQSPLTLKIFVEDNVGRKDTVEFGLIDNTNANIQHGIDTSLGEINIYGRPQEDLDIRSILRDTANHECLRSGPYFSSFSLFFTENVDTKIDYRPQSATTFESLSNNFEFSVHAMDYPVTVRGDLSGLNSSFPWSTIVFLDDNCTELATINDSYNIPNDSIFTLLDSSYSKIYIHLEHEVATYKIENLPTWKAFPNPVTADLNIELEEMTSGNIQILNTIGQAVKVYSFENQELIQLSINELPKGIYFVKLYDEKKQKTSTRKIIKQ